MTDIDRTIKGMKHCLARYVDGLCDDCPYMGEIDRSYMIPMKCKELIIKDALSVISDLQDEIPKWIPVDERLPDDYEKVLIFDKKWGVLPGWHSKNYWETSEVKTVTEITHWMPKPTPPKAGDQE